MGALTIELKRVGKPTGHIRYIKYNNKYYIAGKRDGAAMRLKPIHNNTTACIARVNKCEEAKFIWNY